MAQLLIDVQCSPASASVPKRLFEHPGLWSHWKDKRILELGCGVGLTGLIAASLGARAVLLTDLSVVVERVSKPNIEMNSAVLAGFRTGAMGTGTKGKAGGPTGGVKRVAALPLCWGNTDDERAAAEALDVMAPPFIPQCDRPKKRRAKCGKKGGSLGQKKNDNTSTEHLASTPPFPSSSTREGMPDVILIGDVAYQHKPGAPSHFDALISTVLRVTDGHTVVIFGTRMRMPASADLLDMFLEHFDEVVLPPIEAHEVDETFRPDALGRKHNISIHVMKRKVTAAPSLTERRGDFEIS